MLDDSALDHSLTPLTDAARWVVAFSGGLDSTALLHLLLAWRERRGKAPAIAALHINHQLQAAADDWQAHCRSHCADLDVAFQALCVDTQGSGEAAARDARYRAFEHYLQPGDVLMLAHHLDDQVETFFLRLLRGAGLEGLSAMPASRPLGDARLARPLLHLTRAELAHYVNERGWRHIDDPTNADASIDRNFLRHQVLPVVAAALAGVSLHGAARQRAPGARCRDPGGSARCDDLRPDRRARHPLIDDS